MNPRVGLIVWLVGAYGLLRLSLEAGLTGMVIADWAIWLAFGGILLFGWWSEEDDPRRPRQ